VFCVDQEHADEMRRELNNLNADIVRDHSDYVCRVTSDEGKIGAGHLSRFQELETETPVILTTSQMLTTGVDAPTCKNIVLARVIGSMTDFKQIIGRGTRVREDYGKLFFNILDYTGSATRMFADPDFDGDPVSTTSEAIDDEGVTVPGSEEVEGGDQTPPEEPPDDEPPAGGDDGGGGGGIIVDPPPGPRKYYVDGGIVEIVAHLVYELDADGRQLRVVQFTDYAAEKVRTLFPTAEELRQKWADPVHRSEIADRLEERGISFDQLATEAGRPDADPFDLLCHFAYDAPLRTRRERAERLRRDRQDFFDRYGPQARAVLEELLEKYADHGADQLELPAALKVPPLSERGTVMELANLFGGGDKLRLAVAELQQLLYAA
jgi:type I restriction enzyme, R subunit